MNNILIDGYGNIGKHIYKEFKDFNFSLSIHDPYKIPNEECNFIHSSYPAKSFDFEFICVPTDSNEDGSCDTSVVEELVKKSKSDIIIIKSTVPVGFSDYLYEKYSKKIVFSPEYYGTTLHSYDSTSFLILGGEKEDTTKVAQLYYHIKTSAIRIYFSDRKTAELVKYMENCFLALKVTFCNEFADIAKKYDIEYEQLRELFILDDRIGDSHTFVYKDQPYYDSHCLNKDIPALINIAGEFAPLMSVVNDINKRKKEEYKK